MSFLFQNNIYNYLFRFFFLYSVFNEQLAALGELTPSTVSALSYLPVQSPVKYFHHCRA